MQYLDSVISNPYQTSLAQQSDDTLALSCVCQCSLMVEETKNGQKKKTRGSAKKLEKGLSLSRLMLHHAALEAPSVFQQNVLYSGTKSPIELSEDS